MIHYVKILSKVLHRPVTRKPVLLTQFSEKFIEGNGVVQENNIAPEKKSMERNMAL